MNLYQINSPNIGTGSIIVKARTHKEASQVARDVIEMNKMSNDEKLLILVTELVPPVNDGVGYCYPKNNTKPYKYTLTK